MLHSAESLKFQDWQAAVEGQAWTKREATFLLNFSRDKKTIWSTFEQKTRERLEKLEEQKPKKVTKTLFTTKTQTHSY